MAAVPFPDHIVLACGSGGTAAGVALAVRLTGRPTTVTAIGVCDSPRLAIVCAACRSVLHASGETRFSCGGQYLA